MHQRAPVTSPPLQELRKLPGHGSKSLLGRPQTNKGRNRPDAADLKCVSAQSCSIRYSELDDVPRRRRQDGLELFALGAYRSERSRHDTVGVLPGVHGLEIGIAELQCLLERQPGKS